jgi:protein-S-isoprenylcysteine O-methyltransferase Ste14
LLTINAKDSSPPASYRWVRQSGYAGALIVHLTVPVFVDLGWASMPAVTLVVQTRLQNQTLQEPLPGYGEYAQQVRFRLIPEVWSALDRCKRRQPW